MEKIGIDPDDSNLKNPYMRAIYYLLWGKRIDLGKEIENKGIYENGWMQFRTSYIFEQKIPWGGETINSLATFFKDKSESLISGDLETYCRVIHQLGNFLLVPAYFNQWKGIRAEENIFIALLELKGNMPLGKEKRYSLENGLNSLRESKKASKKEKKDIVKKRFDEFQNDSFPRYINVFFLWDYVEYSKQQKNYLVKSLSINTDDSETSKINDKEKFRGFVDKVTYYIQRRGYFMAAMLMIAVELRGIPAEGSYAIKEEWKDWNVSDSYKVIMQEVLSTDMLYLGYEEVFAAINALQLGNRVDKIIEEAKEKIEEV